MKAVDPFAVRMSEAGLALLAARTGDPQLRRSARRRFRLLVAPALDRFLRGRSIRSVAQAADIHFSILSRALNGKRDLFTRQAVRLAAVLDRPVTEVLEYLETVQAPQFQTP